MRPTLGELRLAAYRAGFEIKHGEVGINNLGLTDSVERIIWLAPGLRGRELRSTLAHETVHALLGHSGPRCTWRGNEEPWLDAAIDVIAAANLFTEEQYHAAIKAEAEKREPRYEAVARRLGVDRTMLRNWNEARKATISAEEART